MPANDSIVAADKKNLSVGGFFYFRGHYTVSHNHRKP